MRLTRFTISLALGVPAWALAQVPTFNDVFVANVPTLTGTASLRMDIYKPANATGNVPIVAWIHGGAWQSGTYNSGLTFAKSQLLARGIAVANIGYRLSGQEIFPAQIQDVKGMIRHLRANALTYGIDPRRIGAWGPSAGGHLTALLATSGGVASLEGTTGGNLGFSSRVIAGVDYYGPTDLLNMELDITNPPGSTIDHDAPESGESKLIGYGNPGEGVGVLRANINNPAAPFPELRERIINANPITHADTTDPVMFIAHGTVDTVVPMRQSTRLHDSLTLLGVPHEYVEVAGAGHGPMGVATDQAAASFMAQELTRTFGDATRDGAVNISDFAVLAQNFGRTDVGWRQGDFTADGRADLADFALLAANYNTFNPQGNLQAAGAAVPEPAMGLLLAALPAAMVRRRRSAEVGR